MSAYDIVYIFAFCIFLYFTYLGLRLRHYKKKEQNSKKNLDSDRGAELQPDFESLDNAGREAVRALVKGLRNKVE